MVSYNCPKCDKIFDKKSNYISHINKKYACNTKNKIESLKNIKEYKCAYCELTLSTKYNLNKHVKHNCKIKKQKDKEKEDIFKKLIEKDTIIHKQKQQLDASNQNFKTLISEFKILKNDLKKHAKNAKIINNNTTTNNTNSNNTCNTNNIIMNFGSDNIKIVDKNEFIKIVNNSKITGVKIPDEIMKAIYFNDKYPQLNNIYVSDMNRNKCMIIEDNEWKLSSIDQIPQIINNIVKYSNEKNEELSKKYKDNKSIINRLQIIDKYIKLSDSEYLIELIEDDASKKDIDRCKDFQQLTYNTIKNTLYNKGKKINK
jgi:hypothetical protein